MKILTFKDFMKKYNSKNDTMNESQLQKVYNYPMYPRDSKINSEKGFVNIDNGRLRGTHWCVFYVKGDIYFTLIVLVVSQINFYLNNYLNR